MPNNPPLTDAERSMLMAGGGYGSIQQAIDTTQSTLNYENGDEASLTQKQIINIVIKLDVTNKKIKSEVYNVFQNTNFGKICLN